MKQSMLDYILLSPIERERLHITLIPQQSFISAERIALEGGFSSALYSGWHGFV